MTLALHILFASMAWVISATRLVKLIQRKAWNNDRVAVHIWWATLLFALVVTFLITPAGEWIDRYTLPNFARFAAYVAMMLTLHLIVSSFLSTIQTRTNLFLLNLLPPFLVASLIPLSVLYGFFVSNSPAWIDNPNPSTGPQAVFQLIPFSWAAILCLILAIACQQYLRHESVAITRYRITFILLTAISGMLMFVCKFIFILGFFRPSLFSVLVQTANSVLEISTVLLWGGSFVRNSAYTRLDSVIHGLRSWAVYQDLSYLAAGLREVCPSVGLEYQPAGFWKYVRRADYYLYRAVVRILDGKMMLSEVVETSPGEAALLAQEQARLHALLQQTGEPQSFEEMVSVFSQAGRKLRSVDS